MEKSPFKEKAIELRKTGLSYSEILKEIPVSESSLSSWLGKMKLNKKALALLEQKRVNGQRKGAVGHHNVIVREEKRFRKEALREIKNLTKQEFFLVGLCLYWGEGSKTKSYRVTESVILSNSDPLLIKLFIRWLKESIQMEDKDLTFQLYLHETQKCDNIIKFWVKELKITKDRISVYYKHNKVKPNRFYYISDNHGVLRVIVRRSAALNRKISIWIETMCKRCGVV